MKQKATEPRSSHAHAGATVTTGPGLARLRETGIELIGGVPWGTHFCQFYQTDRDLIDTLVPYFKAGLESNEFCMWITSEPLGVEEAATALRAVLPDLDRRIDEGQIEILPHTEWYLQEGSFDQERVMSGWVRKLNAALAKGYEGLRLNGNTFWLEKDDWEDFTQYEETVNNVIGGYRMLAICTYSLDKCGAGEVADVVANHEFAFMKRHGKWTVIESSTVKQAKQALEDLNEELRSEISERTRAEEALRESERRVRQKLDSILSPEGDIGNLELADIIDSQSIQSLMDSFYQLASIPMAIIDVKGKVLVGVGWQDICTRFHRVHPETCAYCIESDTQLTIGVPPGESRLYRCRNNMWDIATPIIIAGRHMGNLFSGQFFFDDEPIDYDLFRAQARLYGFDEAAYLEALDKVPRLSHKTLGNAMSFFVKLANTLSQLSHSNIELTRILAERERAEEALRQNEERLKRSQEIAHLGSWELDLGSNSLSWSDEAYRIFGLEPQEFGATYEAFLEAVHPEDRAAVDDAYSSSVREGRDSYEIEHRVVRRRDGEVRTVHERCQHFRDESGSIIRSTGMVHDITERVQAEQRLAEASADAEQRAAELESFISSTAEGVVLHDAEGNAMLTNKAAKEILGSEPQPSVAERVRQFSVCALDGTPMKPDETASGRALRGETVREARYRFAAPNGTAKVIAVSSSPVLSPDGRVLGATTVFRDVTAQHEFERQREELLEREHYIADMLQRALIPPAVPKQIGQWRIGASYRPALSESEVGGDFYDVFDLGDGKIGLLIGDVAGKGLKAAIRVAAARYSVRSYAFVDSRPSRVLTLANEALSRDSGEESSMLTAFYAVIETSSARVTYSSAGHEPPLVCRASGSMTELGSTGLPLGVIGSATYSEELLDLTPGDSVVMVTDGITEARASGRLFEKKGMIEYLSSILSASPDEVAAGLLKAATDHAGGHLQDDAAVLILQLGEKAVGDNG